MCEKKTFSMTFLLKGLEKDITRNKDLIDLYMESDKENASFCQKSLGDFIDNTISSDKDGLNEAFQEMQSKIQILEEKTDEQVNQQCEILYTLQGQMDDAKSLGHKLLNSLEHLDNERSLLQKQVETTWSDITVLEAGRQTIQSVTKFLKFLKVFVIALSNIRTFCTENRYDNSIPFLIVLYRLVAYFNQKQFTNDLQNYLQEFQEVIDKMKAQLMMQFDILMSTEVPSSLNFLDACKLVDTFYPRNFRKILLLHLTEIFLEDYTKNFPDQNALTDPHITLQTFDRRYIFFKKLFRQFPSKYDQCFLKEWNVLLFITHEFCRIVRYQLISLMDVADPNSNVQALLKTQEFELYLNEKFQERTKNAELSLSEEKPVTFNDCLELPIIKEKLPYLKLLSQDLNVNEDLTKNKDKAVNTNDSSCMKLDSGVNSTEILTLNFHKVISSCFDSFVKTWIKNEENRLACTMQESLKSDEILYDQHEGHEEDDFVNSCTKTLYSSCITLLVNMKKCYHQYQTFARPDLVVDLVEAFQKNLNEYLEMLATRTSTKLLRNPETVTVAVLGTVEYMEHTLPYLIMALQKIEILQDKEILRFQAQFKALSKMKASTLTKLFSLISRPVKSQLYSSFHSSDLVDEKTRKESVWVQPLSDALKKMFDKFKPLLSRMLLRLLCDIFLRWFICEYRKILFEMNKSSVHANKNLRLASEAIMKILYDIPQYVLQDESPLYTKYLLHEFSSIQSLLKDSS
ncbi:vacuolar protein sorting-associated protein 53 homolog isoform X2 [Hylaeus volcanicus]|uniref:vacuolar protein sorting-associated protein 53 homolog isoform X2 n=1 Tax=Hylaeus volcanicus TaxID=313075 RepID=UPI0023B84717|nr:vacuolar protein sorting-associated protein 53 homolog isoform X2 [Hylaeus volcanicus]